MINRNLIIILVLALACIASAQPMLVSPSFPGDSVCLEVDNGFVYIFDGGVLSKYKVDDFSLVITKDLYIDPDMSIGVQILESHKKP